MKLKLFILWFCFIGQLLGQGANKALSFDGSNDYVEVPDQTALNPSTFTLEAWIKTSQTTAGRQTGTLQRRPKIWTLITSSYPAFKDTRR